MQLHLVTDYRPGRDALAVLDAALSVGADAGSGAGVGPATGPAGGGPAGVDVVQVRAKGLSDRDLYELAGAVLAACRARSVACVINDRVDLALALGADGVHVGDEDLPVGVARRLLGPHALVGATARDASSARAAVAAGASYLGVGPCFATATKDGLPDAIGPSGLAAVVAAVAVPVVAIGGVTAERIPALREAGAAGVAVVAAVSEAGDPAAAVRSLRAALGGRP